MRHPSYALLLTTSGCRDNRKFFWHGSQKPKGLEEANVNALYAIVEAHLQPSEEALKAVDFQQIALVVYRGNKVVQTMRNTKLPFVYMTSAKTSSPYYYKAL